VHYPVARGWEPRRQQHRQISFKAQISTPWWSLHGSNLGPLTMLPQTGFRALAVAPLSVRQRVRVAQLSTGTNRFRRGSTLLKPVLGVGRRTPFRHIVSAELSDKGRRFRAADVEVPVMHPVHGVFRGASQSGSRMAVPLQQHFETERCTCRSNALWGRAATVGCFWQQPCAFWQTRGAVGLRSSLLRGKLQSTC
jgi:hypothetical protein